MKAVGLTRYLPIDDPQSLVDIELPVPQVQGRDLLIRTHAIAVNPVDTKLRKPKNKVEASPRILGWDAAGEVVETGPQCTLFKPGDKVFYAGDVTRPGCNAEYQLVAERIVGHMPQRLNYAQAAALPLTAVTAWEALFVRLGIPLEPELNRGKSLLIVGGAGGVGSIAIQLARLAGLVVIATASRPETVQWVKNLGAQHVINHRHGLAAQMQEIGIAQPDHIFCCSDTDAYFAVMAELIKPQGSICLLVDAQAPLDINLLKAKSVKLAWESMFTRSLYKTADMQEQHRILERVAALIDAGQLKTTLNQVLSPINAANLRQAHAELEAGTTIGKTVLSGW